MCASVSSSTAIMPEAEQVHFDESEIGAVILIPLHDDAARHGGRFERHYGIELSLADDHTAGVLAEVARQILHARIKLEEFSDARLREIEARIAKLPLGSIAGVLPLPGPHQRGKARQNVFLESEDLADFARGGAAAVGDDICGHGGAAPAVALVDVLDDALALVSAGQVEVDIRPLAALLGKEALEQ